MSNLLTQSIETELKYDVNLSNVNMDLSLQILKNSLSNVKLLTPEMLRSFIPDIKFLFSSGIGAIDGGYCFVRFGGMNSKLQLMPMINGYKFLLKKNDVHLIGSSIEWLDEELNVIKTLDSMSATDYFFTDQKSFMEKMGSERMIFKTTYKDMRSDTIKTSSMSAKHILECYRNSAFSRTKDGYMPKKSSEDNDIWKQYTHKMILKTCIRNFVNDDGIKYQDSNLDKLVALDLRSEGVEAKKLSYSAIREKLNNAMTQLGIQDKKAFYDSLCPANENDKLYLKNIEDTYFIDGYIDMVALENRAREIESEKKDI